MIGKPGVARNVEAAGAVAGDRPSRPPAPPEKGEVIWQVR